MRLERYLIQESLSLNKSLKRDILKTVEKFELKAEIGIDNILRKITDVLKIDNRNMIRIARTILIQLMQAGIID